MAKKRNPRWTWREYGLQVSVVIIGIVITFVGSDLISRWSRQRDVKSVMHLVVEELKENGTSLNEICDKLLYDRRGMLLIAEYDNDIDAVPLDSLVKYRYILGSMRSITVRNDALEVLKTSGVIPSINDKSLLMDIMRCYSALNEFSQSVDSYNQLKMTAINHLQANPLSDDAIQDDNSLKAMWKMQLADPVCASFFSSAAYYFGFDDNYFVRTQVAVVGVIEAINKKYNLK